MCGSRARRGLGPFTVGQRRFAGIEDRFVNFGRRLGGFAEPLPINDHMSSPHSLPAGSWHSMHATPGLSRARAAFLEPINRAAKCPGPADGRPGNRFAIGFDQQAVDFPRFAARRQRACVLISVPWAFMPARSSSAVAMARGNGLEITASKWMPRAKSTRPSSRACRRPRSSKRPIVVGIIRVAVRNGLGMANQIQHRHRCDSVVSEVRTAASLVESI